MVTKPIENPFSSHYIEPFQCGFVEPSGDADGDVLSIEELIQLLANESNHVLQIVGPHGCGKTTLAVRLARSMHEEFSTIRFLTVREATRIRWLEGVGNLSFYWTADGSIGCSNASAVPSRGLIVIDGIERLSAIHRLALFSYARRNQIKILVTTHRKLLGVDTLVSLRPNLNDFKKIVGRLLGDDLDQMPLETITRAFHCSKKNYLVAIRQLYDAYESGNIKT